ncbi:hypothetical protein IW261DRAFT_1608297 [Armillaria novae-zelandiae]|uniref:Uncharacterized protein n=1 Tax=Armillaria novae-zelandiae TaxID=153914 RepID=A0AA39P7S3_9AGAR|nr:hypothetical protein IW261DRAFT_1608297 [Armillaria novae-zelandiae]
MKKIQAIRDNPVSKQHMQTYADLYDKTNLGEKSFYHPYGLMCNDAFDVLREKARTMKTGKKPDWALDYLPNILLCQDTDSTQTDIVTFCKKTKFVETIDYERRICRITVQEKLYPLEELRTVEGYAQVFFDILQTHKRLTGNIMRRRTVDGRIRGVLNDFDLFLRRSASELGRTWLINCSPTTSTEILQNILIDMM